MPCSASLRTNRASTCQWISHRGTDSTRWKQLLPFFRVIRRVRHSIMPAMQERYGFYLTRNRADAENSGQFTTASNHLRRREVISSATSRFILWTVLEPTRNCRAMLSMPTPAPLTNRLRHVAAYLELTEASASGSCQSHPASAPLHTRQRQNLRNRGLPKPPPICGSDPVLFVGGGDTGGDLPADASSGAPPSSSKYSDVVSKKATGPPP
jgi:hypothetical protein